MSRTEEQHVLDGQQMPQQMPKDAPAQRGHWLVGSLPEFRRPLHFFRQLSRQGSVARFRLGWVDCYLVSSPEGIEQVLTNQQDFSRDTPVFNALRQAFGQGLITSDGQEHLWRRRLMQPAFHHSSLQLWQGAIQTATSDMLSGWQPGGVVDIGPSMIDLTWRVLGQVLFSADLQRSDLQEAFGAIEAFVNQSRWYTPPLFVPTPLNRRFKRARHTLDRRIGRLIEEHQSDPDRFQGDILSFLLQARDGEGRGFSSSEVLHEINELIPAGHETTASGLMWVWYLLAENPEVEERLRAEVCDVLGDRLPTIDDLGSLPYLRCVLTETLRLYPPIYTISRRACRETEVCGSRIPAGALIFVSPWVTQRDPAYWPDPHAFRPERFDSSTSANKPLKGAYIPFGDGSHRCIGERLAMIEGEMIIAQIAQRHRLRLVDGQDIRPGLFPALRPRYGLQLIVE
jgi:cytochrome P450